MEKRVILEKEINLLKNIIQEIIDEYKIEINILKKEELLIKKNTFVEKLNFTVNALKIDNEISKVIRESDSLNYHRVKNKTNSSELMYDIKQKREDAKNNFEKLKIIEMQYDEKEIKEIPGFLFFDKNIIDIYGICPFIELSDTVYNDRQDWLINTYDKGLLYYDLYDKIVNKKSYNQIIANKQNLELEIERIHLDVLCEQQYILLQNIKESIIEYNSSETKNKKIKDKFKEVIRNTDSLFLNSGLQINTYLSEYYMVHIPNTKALVEKDKLLSKIYYGKVQLYKDINQEIQSSLRFISNTVVNLKQLLYEYLYKKSNIKYVELGKFFKKWSLLNNDEKLDRYESFSENFINKYFVEPKLIDDNKINSITHSLKQLFIENYTKIKYKSIKWNVNRGIIEQVFCLKYNNTKEQFNIDIKEEEIKQINKIKKPISIRTILNKDTNKIINEEILIFLIQLKKSKKKISENIKESKELIIEKIKLKLHLKRITIKDKTEIYKTFDEIYTVIMNSD